MIFTRPVGEDSLTKLLRNDKPHISSVSLFSSSLLHSIVHTHTAPEKMLDLSPVAGVRCCFKYDLMNNSDDRNGYILFLDISNTTDTISLTK